MWSIQIFLGGVQMGVSGKLGRGWNLFWAFQGGWPWLSGRLGGSNPPYRPHWFRLNAISFLPSVDINSLKDDLGSSGSDWMLNIFAIKSNNLKEWSSFKLNALSWLFSLYSINLKGWSLFRLNVISLLLSVNSNNLKEDHTHIPVVRCPLIRKLPLKPSYCYQNHTVRPLFKKFTQHCETYEPTNCCVKKLHNLFKIVHKLCKIVHKLCNFFTQLLVGSYVSQCCVKF